MIYFVTGQRELFEFPDAKYKCISVEESLKILEPLRVVGLDTETTGTEIWQGKLLTLQLGNKENQVVIDCMTTDVKQYKDYFESDRLFIIHNAKFDLRWLYKEHIVVRNVYDTYLAEKILYLGFPPGIISLSLQACCDRYLNVFLDKTVRGKIHVGMTEDVIVYAANDVVYLEDIMNSQLPIISARGQRVALDIENEFVRVLAYIEFCGIRLDPEKWKAKMVKDAERLRIAEQKLNEWVVDYVMKKNDPSLIASNYDSHKKGKPAKLADSVYVVIPAPSLFSEFDTGPQCIINWNSSKQVIRLFEELGFDLLVKDKKTGKMKKSVESKYIELQADKSTIVPLYLEYSAAFKVVTSFGQNFLDAINPVTHRIHPTFNQMMDTGRLSCGSGGKGKGGKTKDDDIAEEEDENKDTTTQSNDKSVNIQQLPATEETRAAFIPEKGHMLIDCDYGDQEGHVFTELSGDKEWIDFYNDPNQRDGHSFVAKMCFPKDLDGIEEKDVKKMRKDLRDLAKKARFCFNYNGQAPTMATNCNIPVDFATEIYNNYFKRFYGIADYFKVQKRDMWNRGYILISKITGLRAYIYDYPILKGIERRKNGMEDFWDIYKAARDSGRVINEIPPAIMQEIAKRFAEGKPIEEIAVRYSYKVKKAGKVEERFIDINRETVYVSVMKHLWKRKSASDNQSCNYPSQGTAAAMTKIAGIRYFNHLVNDGLIFKVLIPNDVHDEYLIEPPTEIAEQEAKKLSECMEYAAAIFCKKVTIKAVPEIGSCWIH
jgi:DNA polymerase I-like protein with 3'-5' exonuclease and polymerase domains|nr:MAG TPA: Prex DNA polymerase [Caudoviricetes sp.]